MSKQHQGQSPVEFPRWLGIKELSSYLGRSVQSIRKDVREKRLPATKIGGQVKFDKLDIDRLLDAKKFVKVEELIDEESIPIKNIRITPARAIRIYCIHCFGGKNTKEVRIEISQCTAIDCPLYPYRMGRGRGSVKAIRKLCLECMGGSTKLVRECTAKNCPVYFYRLGKNPKREGVGNKKAAPPHFSLDRAA